MYLESVQNQTTLLLFTQASSPLVTHGKNNLFRKSNARDNELRHENGCIKSSSQLRGEHCKCSSDFFPSEYLGLCRT